MGTLYNQRPYEEKMSVESKIREYERLAKKYNLELFEVIEIAKIEMKRAELDTRDEQLSGIGELITDLISEISYLGGE